MLGGVFESEAGPGSHRALTLSGLLFLLAVSLLQLSPFSSLRTRQEVV
jgi:hypothetical protein